MNAPDLAYHLEGADDAPVVVLASAIATDMRMWNPQRAVLSQDFRVLRYDQRGHGGSPTPPGPYRIDDLGTDLVGLLDRLEIERAHVCGVSLGGMVGMWMGIHAPERVDRLVLACTAPERGPADRWHQRARQARESGLESMADDAVSRWISSELPEERAGDLALLREMFVGTDEAGYAACCEAIGGMDFRDALHRVVAPTLVISGGNDPAVPIEDARALAEAIPGARHVNIADASHLANVDAAETFNELVLQHLRGS